MAEDFTKWADPIDLAGAMVSAALNEARAIHNFDIEGESEYKFLYEEAKAELTRRVTALSSEAKAARERGDRLAGECRAQRACQKHPRSMDAVVARVHAEQAVDAAGDLKEKAAP